MEINKKYLLCLFSLILILSGCHSEAEKSNPIRIAYIAKIPQKIFHDIIRHGINKAASKHQVRIDFFPANNQRDIETQKRRLQEISQNKYYDGVLLAPNDSQALLEDVRALDRVGIWFMIIDTPLLDPHINKITHNCGFVGTDNILAGRMAAKYIKSEIDGGSVLMMRGNHKQKTSIDREKGFVEEIKKYNQFKIASYLSGYWEMEPTANAMSKYLNNHIVLPDAVFAYSDTMAVAVSKYFESIGMKQRPIIVGVDGVMLGQQAILTGKIDASIVQAPEVMGEKALEYLLECIKKNNTEHNEILTPVTLLKASRTLEVVNP